MSANFIDTSCLDVSISCENLNIKSIDPLQEVGTDMQQKCYKVDSVVFAEPLEYNTSGSNSFEDAENSKHQNDITVIDNIIVEKRTGRKYKKYHIFIEDTSNLFCPQPNCNRKFLTTKLLKAHIRKVHCADRTAHICEVCGATFKCRYLLVRHAGVHSGSKVQCSVCAKVLSGRTSLSAHLRTHSGIKPHTCSTCKKQFTRKSTLDTHIKFVHKADGLQCPKCPDRFETRLQWRKHLATHPRSVKQDGARGS